MPLSPNRTRCRSSPCPPTRPGSRPWFSTPISRPPTARICQSSSPSTREARSPPTVRPPGWTSRPPPGRNLSPPSTSPIRPDFTTGRRWARLQASRWPKRSSNAPAGCSTTPTPSVRPGWWSMRMSMPPRPGLPRQRLMRSERATKRRRPWQVLRSLLGIDVIAKVALADANTDRIPSRPALLSGLEQEALDNRPELRMTDARIEALGARARAVDASRLPTVGATGQWLVARPNQRYFPWSTKATIPGESASSPVGRSSTATGRGPDGLGPSRTKGAATGSVGDGAADQARGHLTKVFGEFVAVDRVSFEVPPGRDLRFSRFQRCRQNHRHPDVVWSPDTDIRSGHGGRFRHRDPGGSDQDPDRLYVAEVFTLQRSDGGRKPAVLGRHTAAAARFSRSVASGRWR